MKANTFYFNKDPFVLNMILNLYNEDKFHIDDTACGYLVSEELEYWQIDEMLLESCCQQKYYADIDTIDEKQKDETDIIMKYKEKDNFGTRFYPEFRSKVWATLEYKETWASKIYFLISFLFWLLTISAIILETISGAMTSSAYWYIVYLVVSFFTLELILRIAFCPNKLKFFLNPLHIIDFCCITQDFIFMILLATTSTTTVVGAGNNSNGGQSGGPSGGGQGPAPPGGAGGASLDTSTSEALQKYNKIARFFYVCKIFRYFSSLKILAKALVRGWKPLSNYIQYFARYKRIRILILNVRFSPLFDISSGRMLSICNVYILRRKYSSRLK